MPKTNETMLNIVVIIRAFSPSALDLLICWFCRSLIFRSMSFIESSILSKLFLEPFDEIFSASLSLPALTRDDSSRKSWS
jgi:hypothetical protein